jgi:hypothetical protein
MRAHSTTGPNRAIVLGRALLAELTRLTTVRSTWWSLLAGAGLMLFIGGVAGSQAPDSGETAPIWFAAEFAILPGQFAFLLVVLMAVTGEYATGAIRSTLQWVPRRGVLLTARIVVPVAFATGCAVAVAAATDLVAWALLGDQAEVVAGDIVRSLGMIALVVAVGGLLAVGLGLLLRSTAGTLISIVLLIFALPVMLGNSGAELLTTISEHLPGSAMISLLEATGEPRDAATVTTILVAWPATLLFFGGWALVHRDAS